MSVRCERCGDVRPGTLLGGLCPRCVAGAAFDEKPAGPSIGDYEVVSELGRGGMGIVYLARQRTLDRLVAVKVLAGGALAGALAEERFKREAREAARLRHPSIVAVHEIGTHEGQPFFSMDLIEGEDLARYVQRTAPALRERVLLLVKAAHAVQYAHAAGLLHRDLKPGNLLIDEAGEPHLTDFGLARAIDGDAGFTRAGEIVGSPGYMAPEQLQGEATVASDVYALGAILYFLLTGRPPFVAARLPELIAAVEQGDPLHPRRLDPSIPRDLETIALRALSRSPATRYTAAAAFADELTRWLEGRPIFARPVGAGERAWRWARRNRALAVSSVAFILAVITGVAGVFWQWRRAESAVATTARHLYSADLKVAADAILAGDLGLARRTLLACPVHARDLAWGLLWPQARGDAETEIGTASWTVTHLAVSRDGSLAANTAQHDNVRLWDLVHARPAGELPGTASGWWAAFGKDAGELFTADDRSVKQWDLTRRAIVREFPGRNAVLSPDAAVIFTTSGHRFVFEGEPGPVTAWRVADGTRLFEIKTLTRCMAISPDGAYLALSDDETTITIHRSSDGGLVGAPLPLQDRLWHLAFSPDSSILVGSGWSAAVRIWDLATPSSPPRVLAHEKSTWEAGFAPDGRTLAVGCSDRQVYLWDTRTWERSGTWRGHDNEVWSVAWQPDGRLLSAGRDPRVLRWRSDPAGREPELQHDTSSFRIVVLPGDRIATQRTTDGSKARTEIGSLTGRGVTGTFSGETPLAFDWRKGWLWLWADSGELCARDSETLGEVRRIQWPSTPGETVRDVPFVNPQADRAWAVLADGSLAVHALEDGVRIRRYANLAIRRLWAADMSPDGTRFAWGGLSGELFLLDLGSGETRALAGHRYDVACITFSRDGSWFVTGGTDGLLFAWDSRTGRRLYQVGQHATSVGRVAISRDGSVILSHEEGVGVHLWHPSTGRAVGFIDARDTGNHHWMGLSNDERWLVLRRSSGAIRTLPVAYARGEVR